jgi:hypothetical protein
VIRQPPYIVGSFRCIDSLHDVLEFVGQFVEPVELLVDILLGVTGDIPTKGTASELRDPMKR